MYIWLDKWLNSNGYYKNNYDWGKKHSKSINSYKNLHISSTSKYEQINKDNYTCVWIWKTGKIKVEIDVFVDAKGNKYNGVEKLCKELEENGYWDH